MDISYKNLNRLLNLFNKSISTRSVLNDDEYVFPFSQFSNNWFEQFFS